MKSLAIVAVIAAMGAVIGVAAASRARTSQPDQSSATATPGIPDERYAMGLGRPVELTEGERQQLKMLVPGIEPEMIPAERTGKIRSVLYGNESDSKKRSLIKSLLR